MKKNVRSGKKKKGWNVWTAVFSVALAVVLAGGLMNVAWFHTGYAATDEDELFAAELTEDDAVDVFPEEEMSGDAFEEAETDALTEEDAPAEPVEERDADAAAGKEIPTDEAETEDVSLAEPSVASAGAAYEQAADAAIDAERYGTAEAGADAELDETAQAANPEPAGSDRAYPASDGDHADAEDAAAQPEEYVFEGTWEGTYVPEADALPDSDELFADYVDRLFYGDPGIATLANYGPSVLEGQALSLYTTLRGMIEEVAAGTRSSTIFQIDPSGYSWTAEELGTNSTDANELGGIVSNEVYFLTAEAVSCLLADCPYELFWYDKISGVGISISIRYSVNGDGSLNTVSLRQLALAFYVAEDYQDGSNPEYQNVTVNAEKITSAQTAAANAKAIAAFYAGLSDEEKMAAYRDEICALTSYNYEAIDNPDVSYGDPWQLIYVFDGDDSTNVVCEGYAKAFQYLCDMGLTDATSYLVTGTMSGGTGAGAHMWNVVNLDGYNYLVDVTNCDTGTIGANGGLFLVNGDSDNCVDAEDPDEYDFQVGRTTIKYLYDEHTTGLYSDEIRTLGTSHIFKIDEEPAEVTELIYGYEGATISVEAHIGEYDIDDLTYQWYLVLEEDETGEVVNATKIEGATDHTLTIPKNIPVGTTVTFLCVIEHSRYELISHDAVVTVAPKEITASVSGTASKIYDGTTDASGLSISLDGVLEGDDVTVSASGYAYAGADAGSDIAVTASGLALGGADASNYVLSDTTVSTTGEILPKTVTATLSGTASKEYDGTTDASGLTVSLDGVLEGDDVKASASGAYASAEVGSDIDVQVTDITLTGADAANYAVAEFSLSTTGEILQKTLTESMVSLEKDFYTYTGEPVTPDVMVTYLVDGTNIITADDYDVTYADNTDLTEEATVTVTGKGNYTGSVTLTFAIREEEEEENEVVADGGDGSGLGTVILPGGGSSSARASGGSSDADSGSGSGDGSDADSDDDSGSGSDADSGSGSGDGSDADSGSGSDDGSGDDADSENESDSDSGAAGGGSGSGSGTGSGEADGSDVTSATGAKTGDRDPISPVRAALAVVLLTDAALVAAVLYRRRPERAK